MPSPSWENLDVFLQKDDKGGFAITVTIEFLDCSPNRNITGIFDEPYLNAQLGEYEVDTIEPRFTCKEIDVVDVKQMDRLILDDGRTFNIMTYPQRDGTGLCILKLEERDDSI
ncbi:hypothetical protein KTJ16_03435 [Acinetobacter bereziniae]|uniref:head-tail joining protein n=1 Tax=Acinetobacter bereziniae TaxID=106648 RepID=UPI0021CD5586|nr:hypothetical protein [Acinetobacter bereziniae]MCU4540228.1 hypothetical protein [Acinetobacter bereziniae]MCU4624266.1 hypothetical protein [Acinetobacter bereziniae]